MQLNVFVWIICVMLSKFAQHVFKMLARNIHIVVLKIRGGDTRGT